MDKKNHFVCFAAFLRNKAFNLFSEFLNISLFKECVIKAQGIFVKTKIHKAVYVSKPYNLIEYVKT